MRQKLGIIGFGVLLAALWGLGFLWFRGDLSPSADHASARKAHPGASASPSDGASAGTAVGSGVEPSPSAAVPPPASVPPPAAKLTYGGKISRADERRAVDINPGDSRPPPLALPPIAEFTMATFNLLGSSHTGAGGEHAGLAGGPQRLNGALSILTQHGISVVGFQEFQPNQRAAFANRAPGWQAYPGLSMGRRAGENSVAWRTDTWELVKPGLISIPYFNGHARPMPYVLLRHKATGVQAYFSTFHNPADTGPFQHQQRFRSEATTREIGLFNQLQGSGIPQLVTGDMNERDEYFCRVTGATVLVAAAGGAHSGGCSPPRPTQIDWIFGSPGVLFSGYTIDRSPTVRRTTDHPVVVTHVTLDALRFKNSYDPRAVTTP